MSFDSSVKVGKEYAFDRVEYEEGTKYREIAKKCKEKNFWKLL